MIKTECIKRTWNDDTVFEQLLINNEDKTKLESADNADRLLSGVLERELHITNVAPYDDYPLMNCYVLSIEYSNPFGCDQHA